MSDEQRLFPCPPGYFIMTTVCIAIFACVFLGMPLFYAKYGDVILKGVFEFFEDGSLLLLPLIGKLFVIGGYSL